jgi:3-dehydroquinate synthase
MQRVSVAVARAPYDILIGPDALAELREVLRPLTPTRVAILTNATVAALYGERVANACAELAPTHMLQVEDGENAKRLDSLGTLLDRFADAALDRRSVVVALGGGVVGDLAGFAAAVYMRGIRFVQVPTTLLAQVDSSVGGKTGINLASGKNLVGAFHQPSAVIADTDTLHSLPPRELSAGLAEVIKHGLLADAAYLAQTESDLGALRALEGAALSRAIAGSCRIKADIVARDEREAGERALLNLGHTFGHAIEALAGYGRWLHGEAVGIGLCLAADLSQRLGLISDLDVARVRRLVAAAGLPTQIEGLTAGAMMAAMRGDKKAEAGRVKFVVLERLGRAVVRQVNDDLVLATLRANGCSS